MISSDEGQGFRRIAARIMELIIRRWYERLSSRTCAILSANLPLISLSV